MILTLILILVLVPFSSYFIILRRAPLASGLRAQIAETLDPSPDPDLKVAKSSFALRALTTRKEYM